MVTSDTIINTTSVPLLVQQLKVRPQLVVKPKTLQIFVFVIVVVKIKRKLAGSPLRNESPTPLGFVALFVVHTRQIDITVRISTDVRSKNTQPHALVSSPITLDRTPQQLLFLDSALGSTRTTLQLPPEKYELRIPDSACPQQQLDPRSKQHPLLSRMAQSALWATRGSVVISFLLVAQITHYSSLSANVEQLFDPPTLPVPLLSALALRPATTLLADGPHTQHPRPPTPPTSWSLTVIAALHLWCVVDTIREHVPSMSDISLLLAAEAAKAIPFELLSPSEQSLW